MLRIHPINQFTRFDKSRLTARANGDQIVVPLICWPNSKLIASGLAHFKYDNVLCVSYGRRQNRETETAVQIAACLGF